MGKADEITALIGVHQITKLLHEIGEIPRLTQLVQRLKALNPRKTDPKLVAAMFLVDQRLFGLLLYGYSVTEIPLLPECRFASASRNALSFTIVFAIGCRAIAQHIGWREM
jgi:hypothetical protein